MQQINGFDSLGEFFDDENFPKGFSKSGDFTITEARLLEDYGLQLESLANGEISPSSSEQQHFIKVLNGEAQPDSPLEKAWLKYRTKIDQGVIAISAFGSMVDVDEDDSDVGSLDDDPIEELDD